MSRLSGFGLKFSGGLLGSWCADEKERRSSKEEQEVAQPIIFTYNHEILSTLPHGSNFASGIQNILATRFFF